MKKRITFILMAALILLSSCGIPSIYVPTSSDVAINKTSNDGEFTVTLSSTVLEEMAEDYPLLYFFYTVSTTSQTSYSTVITNFNNAYCSETGGSVIPQDLNNQPVASYKSSGDSSKEYGIFQPQGLVSYQIGGTGSIKLRLSNDKSSNTLQLLDEEGNVLGTGKRYNSHDFNTLGSDSPEIVDYSGGTYNIKIYALVSCKFTAYSNTYNTKLSYSNPLYEFEITLN